MPIINRLFYFGLTVLVLSILVLVGLFLRSGVRRFQDAITITDRVQLRIMALQPMQYDYPKGHLRSPANKSYFEGGQGWTFSYSGTNQEYVPAFVGVEIRVYNSAMGAQEAYQAEVEERFVRLPNRWAEPIMPSPMAHADDAVVRCDKTMLNSANVSGRKVHFRHCETIARYNDLLVLVWGNVFERQFLSFEEYIAFLQRYDTHVAFVQRYPKNQPPSLEELLIMRGKQP